MTPQEPRTTDYCLSCGESPNSGNHALGVCRYRDPRLTWLEELERLHAAARSQLEFTPAGIDGATLKPFMLRDGWCADGPASDLLCKLYNALPRLLAAAKLAELAGHQCTVPCNFDGTSVVGFTAEDDVWNSAVDAFRGVSE